MSNLTDENNPIKRIINSSMEEIETIIAIMYMTKQAVALPAILNIMKLGDDAGLFDALFKFGTLTVLFEYDGGRWHNADRLNRDTSKSMEALQNDKNCVVIRLRQESSAKMDAEDPRLSILNFKHFNRRKCAIEVLDAIETICETMKIEVPDIDTEADMDEAVIQEAKLYVNKAARMAYEKIYDYSEDDAIRECLLNTNGVITRVNNEEWFKKMDEFRTFMKSDEQFMVAFNGCIPKYLENDTWWVGLRKLTELAGHEKLHTLLTKCLCKRLGVDGFVDALDKLAEKVGWDRMPTLVNGCLCNRLEAPGFVDALDKLAEKVGWDRMPTLVNNCLCKRLEAPGFVDALDKLSVIIGGWEYIPSYCQNQVSSRITSEKYLNSVNDLFQLGKSLGISSDKLRAALGGINPFAPTLISANTWFMNQSADVQLARFRDMTGIYKVRTAKLRDYGWEVSRPM